MLWDSIKGQWSALPILVGPGDAAGKTYIVTGANIGLGYETAKHLVRSSASRVILAVRSVKAGEQAKADIERVTGRTGIAEVWHLDLSSFESVKAFAARAKRDLDRLDVLVGNAAVSIEHFVLSEGVELCLKVNVVSTFLLATLLLPKLGQSGKLYGFTPRLVFVMSALGLMNRNGLHKFQDKAILASLNDPKQAEMRDRYAVTKLVEIYAIRQFAAEFPVNKTGVIINMVDPGLCKTGLARDTSSGTRAILAMLRFIMGRSAEEGCRNLLHAIVADEHGKFLSNTKVKEDWIQPWMLDEKGRTMQMKIWTELADKLEQLEPGCLSQNL